MIAINLAKAAACTLSIGAVVNVCAITSTSAEAKSSLKEFFQTLVQRYDPSSLPKYEDLLKVTDQIAGTPAEDITAALPTVFLALAHQDDNVKIEAAFALTVISRRPDSAQLLNQYVTDVSSLFDSPDSRLQNAPALIFLNLKPTPPPQVPALLLNFVKRTDRDTQAQASAIFTLVRLAPTKPEVVSAIDEFLSRPLDSNARIGVLNALGNPNVKDARLIAIVVGSISDSDQGVRSTAIQVLQRMGLQALQQAEPALQRLADDPKQPVEVTAAAKDAFQRLHPPKN